MNLKLLYILCVLSHISRAKKQKLSQPATRVILNNRCWFYFSSASGENFRKNERQAAKSGAAKAFAISQKSRILYLKTEN
jgi:hypothetical protein